MQSDDSTGTTVRHACAVAVSDEHLWELSAHYIAEGLAAGEHVVYLDAGTIHQVQARLEDDGVCADAAIAAGRLTVVAPDALHDLQSGSADDLEKALHEVVEDVLAQGFEAVRITGEASHAVRRPGGLGPLDHENAFGRVLDLHPELQMLCIYDQQRHPPALLATLREMHAHEITAPSVYDDGLLRIVRTSVGGVRLAGETDHSNRGILDRLLASVLDETLRSPTGIACVTADLASLRFLDVAGAMAFIHAAEQFPTTHRLVLRGVRPRVHRVLERCGALFTPQLELEVRGEPQAPRPSRDPHRDRGPAVPAGEPTAAQPPAQPANLSARRF
ncbi:MAG: MEDS domain-containing protein [Pseudonocardia sp.]